MRHLVVLLRLAWGGVWRRPLQSLFFIVGVSIGVAMIIAIDLANSSANRAFTLSTDAVVGKATHQIVGGPSGVEEGVYLRIRRELGYRNSAPIIEGYVKVKSLDGQPMRLLGVESFAERPFREELGTAKMTGLNQTSFSAFMAEPNTALIGANVSDEYRLAIGESLEIQVGSYHHKLRIVDVIASEDRRIRRSLKDLLVTDIATAQEVFDRIGKLERIDLILPDDPSNTVALKRIESVLPPGARIESSDARRGAVIEMTKAFRLNLTALSLLALVVGMFLIYNTVSFSVIQRRAVIGRLRAIGMTRREVFAMILAEAAVLGVAGALLGVGLGIVLSRGAIGMVTTSINDLFFVSNVSEIDITSLTLLKGVLLGIVAAAIGALIPAYEATRVSPVSTLQRSAIESRTRRSLRWISIGGVAALSLGASMLLPEWHLGLTFLGVLAVLVGVALLTPV
ncbi:MAG: FtsX-like permease family protein, partial [Candidatus Poribacteria bacterium]|nr:FtsX-like permease family protein [Candidatus Poribacteria bacterium]